jgi:hypothetical protein
VTFTVDKHFPTVFDTMKITAAPESPIQLKLPLLDNRQANHPSGLVSRATTQASALRPVFFFDTLPQDNAL